MSTHNICFRGEIRKIFTGNPPFSRLMLCVRVCVYVVLFLVFLLLCLVDPGQHCDHLAVQDVCVCVGWGWGGGAVCGLCAICNVLFALLRGVFGLICLY